MTIFPGDKIPVSLGGLPKREIVIDISFPVSLIRRIIISPRYLYVYQSPTQSKRKKKKKK